MGVEARGRVGYLQSHTAEARLAEALAAAAVSHMAYSKMGNSERVGGGGMRKPEGRKGLGMWIASDQGDITTCWKRERLRKSGRGKQEMNARSGLFPKVDPVHSVSPANQQAL